MLVRHGERVCLGNHTYVGISMYCFNTCYKFRRMTIDWDGRSTKIDKITVIKYIL